MREAEIKFRVRNRDGYKCVDCGMTDDEHYQQYKCVLHVHRLVPGSTYSLDDCVTVCHKCHSVRHGHRILDPKRRVRALNVGSRLRELREAAGLSRKELAELANLKEGGVRDIEQGRRMPGLDTAYALTKVLKVSLLELLKPPAEVKQPVLGRPTTKPKAPPAAPRKRGRPRKETS